MYILIYMPSFLSLVQPADVPATATINNVVDTLSKIGN